MLKVFLDNLKAVLSNLPLVLSESDDPQEVSLHRVMAVFLGTNLVIMAYLLFFFFPAVLNYSSTGTVFGALATLLGVYVVANIGKRYIRVKQTEADTATKKQAIEIASIKTEEECNK